MAKKYNRALDLVLAAALSFRSGKVESAAKYLTEAAESEDFNEAVDFMNDANEGAEEDEGKESTEARFVATASRLNKQRKEVADNEVAPLDTEDLGEGDLPAGGDKSTDSPELRGEKAVEARLARAAHNQSILASKQRRK